MKVQSEVVFGNEKSVHMACQHEGNEFATNMFGLLEDKECIEEIDPGDKPLWGQDSQPRKFGQRLTSHMNGAPSKEADNAQGRCLCDDNQTVQGSVANAENAHSLHLRQGDHTV